MWKRTCNSTKNEQNTGVNVEEEPFQKYLWSFQLTVCQLAESK